MRKILLFTFFISFVSVFSQSFTLSELESLSVKNWDDFDTFVTKKNYSYYSSEEDTLSELREYSFDRNLTTGKATFWITKYKYIDGSEMVSWQTNKQNDYIKIKEQLKILGYKFINSQIHKGSNVNTYERGNKELTIVSGVSKTDSGLNITYYEISVTKK